MTKPKIIEKIRFYKIICIFKLPWQRCGDILLSIQQLVANHNAPCEFFCCFCGTLRPTFEYKPLPLAHPQRPEQRFI